MIMKKFKKGKASGQHFEGLANDQPMKTICLSGCVSFSVCVCFRVYVRMCVCRCVCVKCSRDGLYVSNRRSAVTVDTHMTPDRLTGLPLRLSSLSWSWVEVTETETGELGWTSLAGRDWRRAYTVQIAGDTATKDMGTVATNRAFI